MPFRLGGSPDRSAVLAVGDGLVTDMAGAATFGIGAIFVSGGIHAGEEHCFPDGWRPIATVPSLGTSEPGGA